MPHPQQSHYSGFVPFSQFYEKVLQHMKNPYLVGEGKRRNEFVEWHGLRNDIIMRNVKYGNWRK